MDRGAGALAVGDKPLACEPQKMLYQLILHFASSRISPGRHSCTSWFRNFRYAPAARWPPLLSHSRYTSQSMRRTRVGLVAAGLGCLAAVAVASAQTAPLKPLTWAHDTQLQYGIYNSSGDRYATAYYRILKEEVNGRNLYHIKYMGRNKAMSESAEVWVEPDTLVPIRSTRKVVSGKRTLYVDCAYEEARIVVRHKYEGQKINELNIPVTQAFYDFEELMWIVPQIDWQENKSTLLNYFNSFKFQLETTTVYNDGPDTLVLKDRTYPAQKYHFDVGSTKYTYWTVEQNKRAVPARVFMDDPDDRRDVTFVNLALMPEKYRSGNIGKMPATPPQAAPVQPPAAPPAMPPTTPPTEPAPPPTEPGPGEENPLVPPPDGGTP
jgi:hypothetical protein